MTPRNLGQVAYMPGVTFVTSNMISSPSQPYRLKMNDEEVEKAIYAELPSKVTAHSEVTGAQPQKLVVTDTGLEVPAYILERDRQRKELEVQAKLEEGKRPKRRGPLFVEIGLFATKSPLQATVMALGAGALLAKVYLKYNQK